jgi:hypothetical protein
MAIHKKEENDVENVKSAQELLNCSMSFVSEKKQAVKTMNEMLKDTAKAYGVNKKALTAARDIAFTKGKGWKNNNPFDLDPDADIKDKTSQLFMKLKDTIQALNEIGKTDWLVPYLSALEGFGIQISFDKKDVDETAAKEVEQSITSMNAYQQIKFDNDKLIKEKHAPKADDLNFTRPADYNYVLGLYDKVLEKKNIDDTVQEKFLRLEMLQNAIGLVQNEQEYVN